MISIRWDKQAEKRLFNNIDNFMKDLVIGAEKGVLKGAKWLRATANNKYTPMDTTALIATSYTASVKSEHPTAEVAYIAPYSISVHEDMQKRHGKEYNERYANQIALGLDHKRRDSEQAKFLERPLFEERFKIFEIIGFWTTIK